MNYAWLIFLAVAAISNATMDEIKDRFSVSIFKAWNQNFWNPSISWNYKPKFLGIVEIDAWHILKYIMLGCLFLTVIFYVPILPYHLDFIGMFFYWGLVFELFYSHILIKKP